LNELDKRINSIVSATRKASTGAKSIGNDGRSQYSTAAKSVARSRAAPDSMMHVDVDDQIIQANHGKVIGMTSA